MQDLIVEVSSREYKVNYPKSNVSEMEVNGKPYMVEILKKIDDSIWSVAVNNRVYQIEFDVDTDGNAVIFLDGLAFDVNVTDETTKLLKKFIQQATSSNNSGVTAVKAPMPGMVVKIMAEEGQEVKKGDKIIIIEAMKMENALAAEADGTVKNIKVEEGQAVEKNAVLMEIHAEEAG